MIFGHNIGQGKVKPLDSKVQAILDFPNPTNKKELRRYLGMIGFYRIYCKNLSSVVSPMTELIKKGSKFNFSCDCIDAKSKSLLPSSPVFCAPDFDKEFKLAVDASDVGAGAVLLQEGEDKIDHPVAYFSKKFNKHQNNYSTIEKEALTIVLAIQHFVVYVSGGNKPLHVFTDHNPLTFIEKMKDKNHRILNWSLLLQEHNLCINHIKGCDNVIADACQDVNIW